MTSLAPAAAEQPPIFHAEAARTPLQAAVASELGEGLAESGFLVLPSQTEGFVQAGAPLEEHEVADFGTHERPCPTAVTVGTVPGEPATADAAPMVCPARGGAMGRRGEAQITLWHLPTGMGGTRLEVARRRWACRSCGHAQVPSSIFRKLIHSQARRYQTSYQSQMPMSLLSSQP